MEREPVPKLQTPDEILAQHPDGWILMDVEFVDADFIQHGYVIYQNIDPNVVLDRGADLSVSGTEPKVVLITDRIVSVISREDREKALKKPYQDIPESEPDSLDLADSYAAGTMDELEYQ